VIADFLHAWTTCNPPHKLEDELLESCARHLVGLHNPGPFSLRLRRLLMRSVQYIGHRGFEGVGVENFTGLLNHLHVTAGDIDMGCEFHWAKLLLDAFQTPEGAQHLSRWY